MFVSQTCTVSRCGCATHADKSATLCPFLLIWWPINTFLFLGPWWTLDSRNSQCSAPGSPHLINVLVPRAWSWAGLSQGGGCSFTRPPDDPISPNPPQHPLKQGKHLFHFRLELKPLFYTLAILKWQRIARGGPNSLHILDMKIFWAQQSAIKKIRKKQWF